MNAAALRDLSARAFWTAIQAVLGLITVEMFDIPLAWAPIIAVALSSAKSHVASRVGDPDTAQFDV